MNFLSNDNLEYIRNFVITNIDKAPLELRLKSDIKSHDDIFNFAILQIECRKKNKTKLQSFIENPDFIFPDAISAQQASHEAVAKFHASLVNPKDSVLDMTSGLGIDTLSFARVGRQVTAIDIDYRKSEILKHNATLLGLKNVMCHNSDSLEYLAGQEDCYDIIFIDPSRRGEENKRLYNLRECSPDIISNFETVRQKTKRLIIKGSPMLDISQTLKDFSGIAAIRCIGVKGECKEVLIDINTEKANNEDILMEAINLDNDGNILSCFDCGNPKELTGNVIFAEISDIKKDSYILEPSSMVMKFAPWEYICHKYDAKKLDVSSHLFITDNPPQDFPGRVTKIKKIISKKDWQQIKGMAASVISRNHPLSPETLRKDLKLKEGDENFIYATRLNKKPILIHSIAKPSRK